MHTNLCRTIPLNTTVVEIPATACTGDVMRAAQVWTELTILAVDMLDIALLSSVSASEAPGSFGLVDGTAIGFATLPHLRYGD